MTDEHKPLPVAGYTPQPDAKVALVNEFKADEERLLRKLDALMTEPVYPGGEAPYVVVASNHDHRWIAIARSHFEQGFMALNRSVFQPIRIKLPEDDE